MALDLPEPPQTSTGPLDIAKVAGSDAASPLIPLGDGSNVALDGTPLGPSSDSDESEILHEKNPLGYTITAPTEAEINQDPDKK